MRPFLAYALAASVVLGVRPVLAQGDTSRVINAAPAKWHILANGFYSSADNGFGVWKGQDIRLLHSGTRFSPFANIGSQTRPNGTQGTFGAGSYITISPKMFAIVGVGSAPDNGVVLFPKLRTDASLFVSVPGLSGVLVSAGVTDLRFTDSRTGGQILSLGSMVYRGRGIYSAGLFLNKDRASGARSSSWQAGGQWGAQGSHWFGVGAAAGNEAYRILSVSGFDARFRTQSAYAFVSKWVTKGSGVGLRYDFENKIDVYNRHAFVLSYFVDF
jgi:YaiO family outer membrane protein